MSLDKALVSTDNELLSGNVVNDYLARFPAREQEHCVLEVFDLMRGSLY